MYKLKEMNYEGKKIYAIYKNEFDCCEETLKYAIYLKNRGFASKTIEHKFYGLRMWYEYISSLDKEFYNTFTIREQKKFINFMHKRNGSSSSTINRRMKEVSDYYEFLNEKLEMDINIPLADIKDRSHIRNSSSNTRDYFTKKEIKQLIGASRTHRDEAILITLLTTGLRKSELVTLKLENLEYENDFTKLKKGKVGKLKSGSRKIIIPSIAVKKIREYIIFERNKYSKENEDHIFIKFKNKKGEPITSMTITKLFQRLSERTGIKPCHPHMTRHTFSTNFYRSVKNSDLSLDVLKKLLGHKDIKTTNIYTHLDSKHSNKIKNISNKFWNKNFKDVI